MLYCYHSDAIEVSLASTTNDRITDFDVVFKTPWTCIKLGAILYRAIEVFERFCIGVLTLKVVSRRFLID